MSILPMMVTILLVEDDPNSVFFFEHVIEKLEIVNPVHVVTDGQEALDYFAGAGKFADRRAFPMPGLVILDLKLPRASGFEVLREIRAHPEWRKLIVVILTASGSDDDIAKAYELGANAYLVKPIELTDFTKIVQAIKDFWLTYNHRAV